MNLIKIFNLPKISKIKNILIIFAIIIQWIYIYTKECDFIYRLDQQDKKIRNMRDFIRLYLS